MAAVLLAAPATWAEGPAPSETRPDAEQIEADDTGPPPATPLMKRAAVGRDFVAELGMRSDLIHGWLRDARRAGYRQRAACLDSLLSQTHALERAAEQSRLGAEKAAAAGDTTSVDRELVRLAVFDQRSRGLVVSGQQCGRSSVRAARPTGARPGRAARP